MLSCDAIISADRFDDFVDSGFKIYTDFLCSVENTDDNITFVENTYYYAASGDTVMKDLTTTVIPDDGRFMGETNDIYRVKLVLENNPDKEVKLPTEGDKIGTITVSIKAK